MDKFDQIIDDYKEKKLGVDEAVEKLCALDRENISDVEYTDGEAKEARKSAIEMIEGIEDEALLELMYKYMKRVIDEEKEKKNGQSRTSCKGLQRKENRSIRSSGQIKSIG